MKRIIFGVEEIHEINKGNKHYNKNIFNKRQILYVKYEQDEYMYYLMYKYEDE